MKWTLQVLAEADIHMFYYQYIHFNQISQQHKKGITALKMVNKVSDKNIPSNRYSITRHDWELDTYNHLGIYQSKCLSQLNPYT